MAYFPIGGHSLPLCLEVKDCILILEVFSLCQDVLGELPVSNTLQKLQSFRGLYVYVLEHQDPW